MTGTGYSHTSAAYVSRVSRYVAGPVAPWKRFQRRRWRRVNQRTMGRLNANPELWWGETFQAPMVTTWDLW